MILRVILRFQRGVQLIMQVWTHWPVSLDNSGPILSLFKAFPFKVQVQVHLLKPTPGPNCFLLLPPFFFCSHHCVGCWIHDDPWIPSVKAEGYDGCWQPQESSQANFATLDRPALLQTMSWWNAMSVMRLPEASWDCTGSKFVGVGNGPKIPLLSKSCRCFMSFEGRIRIISSEFPPTMAPPILGEGCLT